MFCFAFVHILRFWFDYHSCTEYLWSYRDQHRIMKSKISLKSSKSDYDWCCYSFELGFSQPHSTILETVAIFIHSSPWTTPSKAGKATSEWWNASHNNFRHQPSHKTIQIYATERKTKYYHLRLMFRSHITIIIMYSWALYALFI